MNPTSTYLAMAALLAVSGLLMIVRPQWVEEALLEFNNSFPQHPWLRPVASGEPHRINRLVLRVVGTDSLFVAGVLAWKGAIAHLIHERKNRNAHQGDAWTCRRPHLA
jgi:hypothetical protein